MADDFATYEGVEAVLAATSDYDIAGSVTNAQRHAQALRRKLHFASSSGREGQSVAYQLQLIESQLRQCLAWLSANMEWTDAQREANPDVLHADFSTLRGYSIYTPPVATSAT